MKHLIFSILLLSLLSGCSSTGSWTSIFSGSVKPVELSGGELTDQKKSFYWYSRTLSKPTVASDYVILTSNAWYKSTYQWQQGGVIQEIVREGEARQPDGELKPFLIHIRFSSQGEAIYQRYRLDDQILPLNQTDLNYYSEQADTLVKKVTAIHDQGYELIQGIWNGSTFDACDGTQYRNINFEQAVDMPQTVKDRINSLNSYAAFVGSKDKKSKTVIIDQLLSLDDASHGCVQRPHLII